MNTMKSRNKNSQPSNREMIADPQARLEVAEKALAGNARPLASKVKASPPTTHAVILERLDHLTLKRHAVLTATLGGVSYFGVAALMECDPTTVKLHLKAVLEILGIRNRAFLLISWPDLLNFIFDAEYEKRYSLGKKWWLDKNPKLMAMLKATKPANNKHTK